MFTYTFENPNNQYREKVSPLSIIAGMILGPIFYALRGVWGHAVFLSVLWLVLFVTTSSITGFVGGFVIALCIQVAWGFFAQEIIAKNYLQRGWKKITQDKKPSAVFKEAVLMPATTTAYVPPSSASNEASQKSA